MTEIWIFGAGRQGSAVAKKLRDRGYDVRVYDKDPPKLKGIHSCYIEDLSSFSMAGKGCLPKLVVNCLPSSLGNIIVNKAASLSIDCVDMSFSIDSGIVLSPLNSILLHDCGLAPGIPNLIVGNALRRKGGTLGDVNIYVGGVSKDLCAPLGYAVTWSLEDLYEEYTRPARYINEGVVRTKHPFYSEQERLTLHGVEFEAFYSDGLRSLLNLSKRVRNMTEFTLRYPGHMNAVHEMIDNLGRDGFVEHLGSFCSEVEDMVYFAMYIDGAGVGFVVEGDSTITAMTKATAYTCSAFCDMILQGVHGGKTGVWSSEMLAEHDFAAYMHIMSFLREEGIVIEAMSEGTEQASQVAVSTV